MEEHLRSHTTHDLANRQQLFEDMISARRELMRSLMFLTEQETVQKAVQADWCTRDIMSHITARECTALAAVRHLVDDGDPHFVDPHGDREFNREAVRRRRDFSLREVIDELDGIRRQLVKYTRKLHNNELYTEYAINAAHGAKSIAQVLHELVEHDYEHASDIWRWRAAEGLMHRGQFRYVITAERNAFMSALGGLFEGDMLSVEVCGYWTVRDVMAHVLSWDEEMLRTVQNWTSPRPWQDEALYDDDWNEVEVATRAELSVVDLADGLATCHRHLVQFFDSRSDEQLTIMAKAPWGERMSLLSFYHEMAQHDAVHRPDLEALQRRSRRW